MLVSLVTWNVDEARALRCASAGKERDRDFHHEETRRHVRPPAKQLVPGLERAAWEWMGRNHPVGCWCVCRRPRKCAAYRVLFWYLGCCLFLAVRATRRVERDTDVVRCSTMQEDAV
jgi:hypothetical protein